MGKEQQFDWASVADSVTEVHLEKAPTRVPRATFGGQARVHGHRKMPSTVRVSHVADYGKRYVKTEVDWAQYKELGKLRTHAHRLDTRRVKDDGTENGRFGKKYADNQQWTVKVYTTKSKKVGQFAIIGKVGRVPLVRELGLIYSQMYAVGLHVTYVHENMGLCVRGKPKVIGCEEETLAGMQLRFNKGMARATSTIEDALIRKMLVKCNGDYDLARRSCATEIKAALAKPRANAENEWGYGLKRKGAGDSPLASTPKYVVNMGHKYANGKHSAAKKEMIKPVHLDADKAKRERQLEIEAQYKPRDAGGSGGSWRVGKESPVVKSLHQPKQRDEVEKNIAAFVSTEMVMHPTVAAASFAMRRFTRTLGDAPKSAEEAPITILEECETENGVYKMCKMGRQWLILDENEGTHGTYKTLRAANTEWDNILKGK